MNLCVFTYDFPHRRSFEFLLTLMLEDIPVKLVVATPWKKLGVPHLPAGLVPKVRDDHPQKIASLMHAVSGARTAYVSMDHDDPALLGLLERYKIDFGLIAGARIIKPAVIDAIPKGILNMHPGKLPEVRGLDPWLWAVKLGVQPTVTGHLINEKVDAGQLVFSTHIGLNENDFLSDLYEKLHAATLFWLGPTLRTAYGDHDEIKPIGNKCGHLYSRIDAESLKDVQQRFPEYAKRWKGTVCK
jgi:phosphoribosylglycinamide formyltransferase-1